MSRPGDLCVICCTKLNNIPVRFLCLMLVVLQACSLDFYLNYHLLYKHLAWIAGDVIVIIFVLLCFILTPTFDNDPERPSQNAKTYSMAWITWLIMQSLVSAKMIVIFTNFSHELDEESSFFGPNTLKTTIALSSCTFVFLLISQHDAPLGSDRRRYIEELTGTVVFDILDTADILEVLLDEDERPGLSSGIPEFILVVATLNLVLPTVPMITLSKTKFGVEILRKRMIYMHRLLLVLAVNVPNLIVRVLLWHGYSVGISPFSLKNIILICMTLYEFYEHKKEKFEEKHREEFDMAERGERRTSLSRNAVQPVGVQPGRKERSGSNQDGSGRRGQLKTTGLGNQTHNKQLNFDIESRTITGFI